VERTPEDIPKMVVGNGNLFFVRLVANVSVFVLGGALGTNRLHSYSEKGSK
jgi:hypothetical protein